MLGKGIKKMKRSSKKSLLAFAVALMFLLAACSGGSGASTGSDQTGNNGGDTNNTENTQTANNNEEKIKLNFWTLGNTNYEELANEYMEKNPHILIEIQNTGDQSAHHNNLTAALSAGSGAPDIFQLEIAFVERFINAQDKFYNLYDLGANDVKDQYLDWKWQQASSIDGSFQIGLPTDIGPTVAYFRTDLAEQAGLPTDPEQFSAMIDTWEKFASVGKDFTEKTGKPFVDLRDLLYNSLRDQSDGEIYYSKEDGSFIGDQNPQVKKAYDYTVKAIQEGWVSNYGLWTPEWNQGINEGHFLIVPGPAWMLGTIKSEGPDSEGLWRIAQLPEGAGNWGGSFITLPKEGKHPEEAYAFIEWMVNKNNQIKSFTSKGLMPSMPEVYDSPEFKNFTDDFLGGQASAVEYAKAAERVAPIYYGPLHDQTDSYIKEALQNVQETGADPEAEWEAALDKIRRLVERSG